MADKAEDTIDLNNRIWGNQSGIDLEASSLLASFVVPDDSI